MITTFPHQLGSYELVASLGKGGMASVYLARARRILDVERLVAIKLLHAHLREESDLVAMFHEEARISSRLRHPNLVGVHDVGESDGGVYLVMDYVEGDSLASLIKSALRRGERIPDAVALRILEASLSGLAAAHDLRDDDDVRLGLVHRDFTPHNILVGVDGSIRLGDFGIVKVAASPGLTRTGVVKGKVGYLAPEQARSQPVDQRSDVWAAGVVAWEVLAGKRLFYSADEVATLLQIVHDPVPSLRSVRPDLSREVDAAIASALTRELDARCPSASEFRARLLAAFRSAGVEPADLPDVGAFARDAVEVTLTKRRQALASRADNAPVPPEEVSAARATLSVDSRPTRATSSSRTVQLIAVAAVAAGIAGSAAYVARGTSEGAATSVSEPASSEPSERAPAEPTDSQAADREAIEDEPPPASTASVSVPSPRPKLVVKPAQPAPSARKAPARLTLSPYDP